METWVARPRHTRSRLADLDLRHRVFAALVAVAFLLAAQPLIAPAGASSGSISGTAFQDTNRDGVQQSDEEPFVDHLIYLMDEDGWVASARTDENGHYTFEVEPGTYRVVYAPTQWRRVWSDWVPTSTGSLYPEHHDVEPGDVVDFAWRPIVKSDDVNDPITETTGPEGLRVQVYNDVITAEEIYEHISNEFLIGEEAATTIVRFAYGSSNANSTVVSRSGGEVTNVRSASYSSYERWLRSGDRTMAHEYGHAWMNYHMYMHWDDDWEALLVARGIDPDDDRLGSSHGWMPGEIAAEDYRQLFASENARSGGQLNKHIPRPWDVEGYEQWLLEEFAGLSPHTDGPSEDGEASEDESDSSGDEGSEEEPSSEDDDSENGSTDGTEDSEDESESQTSTSADEPAVGLSVETRKARGLNYADLTWRGNETSHVDVYRNGKRITTTNGSTFTDDTGSRGSPTYTYQVCETGTDVCSEVVEERF